MSAPRAAFKSCSRHLSTGGSPYGSLCLSGVRIRSRLDALPNEGDWQRLNPLENYRHYLSAAQQTGLHHWLSGFETLSDVHTLEAKLRLQYRQELKTISGWAPSPTSSAVLWFSHLPCLAYLAAPNTGQPPLVLIGDDPCIAATEKAMEAYRRSDQSPPISNWLTALSRSYLSHLPASKLHKIQRYIGSVLPGPAETSAEQSLDSIRFKQLKTAIHQHGYSDTAIVAYTAIQFWLYRRLRAELVPRMLFQRQES